MKIIEAIAANLNKAPWVDNVKIKAILPVGENKYKVVLIDGRSAIAYGEEDLETLQIKKPKLVSRTGYTGPRYQSVEDYSQSKGWGHLSPEDLRDYNWRKRGGW